MVRVPADPGPWNSGEPRVVEKDLNFDRGKITLEKDVNFGKEFHLVSQPSTL